MARSKRSKLKVYGTDAGRRYALTRRSDLKVDSVASG